MSGFAADDHKVMYGCPAAGSAVPKRPLSLKVASKSFWLRVQDRSDSMADDPERQMQYPLTVDFMHIKHMFICGAAASGKSMLLRTMLVGLAQRYTPDQFNCYIAEIGSTALADLGNKGSE